MGLLDMNTSDGRFLFFLPWLGHTVVGTTDSFAQSPVSTPKAPEDEVSPYGGYYSAYSRV